MTDKLITRRSILRGLFAMPAVCSIESLMPVRGLVMAWDAPVAPQVYRWTTYSIGYIINAETVAKIGEGNHTAGALILDRIFNRSITPDTTPPSAA